MESICRKVLLLKEITIDKRRMDRAAETCEDFLAEQQGVEHHPVAQYASEPGQHAQFLLPTRSSAVKHDAATSPLRFIGEGLCEFGKVGACERGDRKGNQATGPRAHLLCTDLRSVVERSEERRVGKGGRCRSVR